MYARRYYITAEPDFLRAGEMVELMAELYRIVGGAHRENVPESVRREIGVNPRVYLRNALYRVKANPGTAFMPHELLEVASDLN